MVANKHTPKETTAATGPADNKSAKIPEDCWELVRRDAFERRTTITQLIGEIIREHYASSNKRRTA